jgi:hypothetical protein
MGLSDNLGGFWPFDFLFDLPWYLTGPVFYALSVGLVAFCARVFHKRAFLLKEQWVGFTGGFIGLGVAITGFSYVVRNTTQHWQGWTGWVLIAVILIVRRFLTGNEYWREENPLTDVELSSWDKRAFDYFSFMLATYAVIVLLATSIKEESRWHLAELLVFLGGLGGLLYFALCVFSDRRGPHMTPHRQTYANDRSGHFQNDWWNKRESERLAKERAWG